MQNEIFSVIRPLGGVILFGVFLYLFKLYFFNQKYDLYILIGYVIVYILQFRVHNACNLIDYKLSRGLDVDEILSKHMLKRLDQFTNLSGPIMLVPLFYSGIYGIYSLFEVFSIKGLFFSVAILINSFVLVRAISKFNGYSMENI